MRTDFVAQQFLVFFNSLGFLHQNILLTVNCQFSIYFTELNANMADSPSTSTRNPTNNPHKTQKRPFSKDHVFKKRQPHKQETGRNVIYVSTKTNTKVKL